MSPIDKTYVEPNVGKLLDDALNDRFPTDLEYEAIGSKSCKLNKKHFLPDGTAKLYVKLVKRGKSLLFRTFVYNLSGAEQQLKEKLKDCKMVDPVLSPKVFENAKKSKETWTTAAARKRAHTEFIKKVWEANVGRKSEDVPITPEGKKGKKTKQTISGDNSRGGTDRKRLDPASLDLGDRDDLAKTLKLGSLREKEHSSETYCARKWKAFDSGDIDPNWCTNLQRVKEYFMVVYNKPAPPDAVLHRAYKEREKSGSPDVTTTKAFHEWEYEQGGSKVPIAVHHFTQYRNTVPKTYEEARDFLFQHDSAADTDPVKNSEVHRKAKKIVRRQLKINEET